MKTWVSMLAAVAFSVLSGCGGNMTVANPTPTPVVGAQSEWTWVAGSNLTDQPGTYGTLGTPAPGNTPGSRENPVNWTDKSGNLWLFGGMERPSTTQDNFHNDLWKFSGGQWTWMGGSNSVNQAGIYGTLGTPDPGNIPGARFQAVSWTDASGNFWLFGGLGLDVNGLSEFLNDLWKFDGSQWTWMGGSKVGIQHQPGVYGTKGTPAPTNVPGARVLATAWTDASGDFWMFGGTGWDSTGALGDLNDLWEFSGGQWTWVSGSNLINQAGIYGVKGSPAPDNIPGGRFGSMSWADAAGNFWIFGGSIGTNSFLPMNDLWKFSGGQWTWISGPNIPSQPGVHGTLGVPAAGNTPGARVEGATWTDATGNLWLFGGGPNDLWKFSAGEWTWMGGPNSPSRGIYGTMGTPSPSNIPGERSGAASWKDTSGNIWLFGGLGEGSLGPPSGFLNDMWKLQP